MACEYARYLHDRREEVSLDHISEQCRLVCTRGHGQQHLNRLVPQLHWSNRQHTRLSDPGHGSQSVPFRTIPSNVLTKSVNTVSMWSSPASTLIMSELGCGYFLDSKMERKMVNV